MFNLLYYEHWTGKRKYFYVIMVRSKLRDSFVHHKTEKKTVLQMNSGVTIVLNCYGELNNSALITEMSVL